MARRGEWTVAMKAGLMVKRPSRIGLVHNDECDAGSSGCNVAHSSPPVAATRQPRLGLLAGPQSPARMRGRRSEDNRTRSARSEVP